MELRAKLQIKEGERIAAIRVPVSVASLFESFPQVAPGRVDPNKTDTLIAFAENSAALAHLMGQLNLEGCSKLKFWVAYPKGKSLGTDINRDSLNEKMRSFGWDAVRLISFDDTWSIMRFKWIGVLR